MTRVNIIKLREHQAQTLSHRGFMMTAMLICIHLSPFCRHVLYINQIGKGFSSNQGIILSSMYFPKSSKTHVTYVTRSTAPTYKGRASLALTPPTTTYLKKRRPRISNLVIFPTHPPNKYIVMYQVTESLTLEFSSQN